MAKLQYNRTWYTKKLAEKAKRCVKARDMNICQMCGKECSGSDCHASHVEPVGAYKNLELDPSNMKVLCSYCHLHRWHKDPRQWGKWFDGMFPERAEYLDRIKDLGFKISTAKLAELHENTKADGSDYANKYYELMKEIL